jgi:hypothetical protein
MTRALLGNGPVITRDTHSQQWNNEVMQPTSRQRLSKQTSAQAQGRHTATVLSRDLFSVLSVRRLYNEYLCKVKSVCGVSRTAQGNRETSAECLQEKWIEDWRVCYKYSNLESVTIIYSYN